MRLGPNAAWMSGWLLLGTWMVLSAEEVQLKGGASIYGAILAEKPDQIVVDLGYTVLSVPKDQVIRVLKQEEASVEVQGSAGAGKGVTDVRKNLFHEHQGLVPEKAVRDLVDQLGEAVVQIRTPSGLGSGFFLNEEGYLITNFHVIEGETQIGVEVYHVRNRQLERTLYKEIRIVAMNKFADLALLRVEDSEAPRFGYLPMADADDLSVGERVFAIGSPLGLERTVTEGIVSTKTREVQGELYIQTTAQINPGNSGGPLFNLRGEVVGVTNMKLLSGDGIGFAIPVEAVRYFLRHRDAYAYDNDNPSNAYRYLEPPRRSSVSGLAAPASKARQ